MKTVIRTLFVWLLLCAIPLQGYAMARMACGAMTAQQGAGRALLETVSPAAHSPQAAGHEHAQHRAPGGAAHEGHGARSAHTADAAQAHGCAPDHGASPQHEASPQHGKCGSVGGCCIAFALPPSPQPVLAASGAVSSAVPFLDRFVADTVLSTLERPPRAALS